MPHEKDLQQLCMNNTLYHTIIKMLLSVDEKKIFKKIEEGCGLNENHPIITSFIKEKDKLMYSKLDPFEKQNYMLNQFVKNKAETSVIILKLIFILTLVVISIYNQDITFIKNYPYNFTFETIWFTIFGTLSIFIVALFRGKVMGGNSLSFSAYIITIFTMIILNILFQISGLYTESFYETFDNRISSKSEEELTEGTLTSINIVMLILIFIYGIYILLIIFFVKEMPVYGHYSKNITIFILIIEGILFGILNTITLIPISIDRKYPDMPWKISHIKNILIEESNNFKPSGYYANFLIMFFLHLALQGTGIYHSFGL